MSIIASLLQKRMILMLSQEWGNLIQGLSETARKANASAVRTNRGPPAEEILLRDVTESPLSPAFPKSFV